MKMQLFEYVDRKIIENLWVDHQNIKENNSGVLWQLIGLSGWIDNYF